MHHTFSLRRVLSVLACLCLVASVPTFAEGDMTLEEILATHIESRGGMDAINALETLKFSGTMDMGGGMEAPLSIEFKRPDKLRMEFTMQGMTGIMAYDGEIGWSIMPFMGKTTAEKMADDQLEQVKEQADQVEGFLINHEEKGHKIELVGKEEVEGTEAYKLKVTTANGDERTVFLDTDYCLEFRQEGQREAMGQKMNVKVNIGDYKEVGGVLFAHSIEAIPEGMPSGQMITLKDAEVNTEIDDDRFAMPEAPEPAEKTEENPGR